MNEIKNEIENKDQKVKTVIYNKPVGYIGSVENFNSGRRLAKEVRKNFIIKEDQLEVN
jgi:hypothetical protein